jgi:hypothetical protein
MALGWGSPKRDGKPILDVATRFARSLALSLLLCAASFPALAIDLQISDLSDTGSDPTPAGGVVTSPRPP